MIRDAEESKMSNNVVDGHIVSHIQYGLLFMVYQYDDFQLHATAVVQAGNCEHFNNPDMKSSFCLWVSPEEIC